MHTKFRVMFSVQRNNHIEGCIVDLVQVSTFDDGCSDKSSNACSFPRQRTRSARGSLQGHDQRGCLGLGAFRVVLAPHEHCLLRASRTLREFISCENTKIIQDMVDRLPNSDDLIRNTIVHVEPSRSGLIFHKERGDSHKPTLNEVALPQLHDTACDPCTHLSEHVLKRVPLAGLPSSGTLSDFKTCS